MSNTISPQDIFGLAKDITRATVESQRMGYAQGKMDGYRKGVEDTRKLAAKEIESLHQEIASLIDELNS